MMRALCLVVLVCYITAQSETGRTQWVQTNGPTGGGVFCLTPVGNELFVGTIGGIFQSSDQGMSWRRSGRGVPASSYIYSIVSRGPNLFAGTLQHGVYRSTDGGASWQTASTGLPANYTVRMMGASGTTLFVPQGGSSYRSSNDGDQWTKMDSNLMMLANPGAILTVGPTTFAAGRWVTQSTDDGQTWSVAAVPPVDVTWDISSLAHIGDILFAGGSSCGVLRSTTNGKTWDDVTAGLPKQNPHYLGTIGTELFVGTYTGAVYRSIDSARTWSLASSGLPTGVTLSALAANGAELLAGFYGLGVFRSFDSGQTWNACNRGFINSKVQSIATVNDTVIVGTTGGVWLSADDGSSWESKQNGILSYSINSVAIDGDNLYAALSGAKYSLAQSRDRGLNWTYPDSGLKSHSIKSVLRSGPNLLTGGDPASGKVGFYRSSDGGGSWSACDVNSPGGGSYITALLKVGSTILASSNANAYVSYDDGLSWDVSKFGINFPGQVVVQAIGAVGDKLFMHCTPNSPGNYGVHWSDDQGNSWHRVQDTTFPVRGKVTCFATVSNTLLAGTDSLGVFLTTDDGAHWQSVGWGLADTSIVSLAVHGTDLLAGTATSGLWRRAIADLLTQGAVLTSEQQTFSAIANPNPFSQSTTIRFTTTLTGPAQVSIVNLLGTEVIRLFSGELQPGEHSFIWDAHDTPAGAYWCDVRVNGHLDRVGLILSNNKDH